MSLGLALGVAGCSSLLYHPSDREYFSAKDFGLRVEDLQLGPLHAWHVRAGQERPHGLVVFFHGNAENLTSHFSTLAWLPAEGFEYLIFDYRGYGKSAGKPTPERTVEDGRRVLEWAMKQDLPLVLFGQSLGGAVLLRSLQEAEAGWNEKQRSKVRLVAIEASFSSYTNAGQSVLAQSWVTWPFQWLSNILLSDRHAPKSEGDSLSWAGQYSWLVIHGSEDRTIEPRLGRELFDSLPDPKRWILTPGGGHISAFWIHDPRGLYPYRDAFLAQARRSLGLKPGRDPVVAYELPFPPRKTARLACDVQASLEFEISAGTPIRAMREGRVVKAEAGSTTVEHEDGTRAEYSELAEMSLRTGQQVRAGEVLGASSSRLRVRLFTELGPVPLIFRLENDPGRQLREGETL